jgi:hypothetical protein
MQRNTADLLPPAKKRAKIRKNPEALYAKNLQLGPMLIMGHEQIYDADDKLMDVVGADKDALKEWTRQQAQRIVQLLKENKILASLKSDGKFVLTAFEVKDGALSRSSRQKTIGAKVCSFYTVPQINALMDAIGIHGQGSRDAKCDLLKMHAHRSNPIIEWIQPEVWSILNDNEENREMIRSMLKE